MPAGTLKDYTCSITFIAVYVAEDSRNLYLRRLLLFCNFQIYTSMRSRVGIPDHLDDGFSCTILRNNDDQKVHSASDIALLAECSMKLIIALSILEECFLPIFDPRTGVDIMPPIVYNWR